MSLPWFRLDGPDLLRCWDGDLGGCGVGVDMREAGNGGGVRHGGFEMSRCRISGLGGVGGFWLQARGKKLV